MCLANNDAAPQKLMANPRNNNESPHDRSLIFIILSVKPSMPNIPLQSKVSIGIRAWCIDNDILLDNARPTDAPTTAKNAEIAN